MAELNIGAEELQEVIDTTEALGRAAGRELVIATAVVGVCGLAVGFTAGYFTARRKLWAKYAKMADDEIESMRADFIEKQRALADQERPDPEALVEELGYRSAEVTPPPIEPEVVEENAFEKSAKWSYEIEEEKRGDYTRPYVIHIDEFTNERPDTHDEMTVMYFAEDDVLCDSRDIPIDDMDELLGLANLDRFGDGSGDPNIVHIRNRQRRLDLEVLRHEGSFAEHVGANAPGEEDPEPRRSRRGDDEQ